MKNVGELRPNKRNPRKISKERQAALKKSLLEFGDLGSVIHNTYTGNLVGGHQRISVVPKDAPITIEVRYNPPTKTGTTAEGFIVIDGEKFKYREVRWDEVKEKAAMIAANAHGGEWDSAVLAEEMSFLKAKGVNMELTGVNFDFSDVKLNLGTDPVLKDFKTAPQPQQAPPSAPKEDEEDESDEDYVRNTEQTTEEIDTERPSNVKYEKKGFDEVEEQQGVKGQRFVIIIDCKDQDSKAALKEKLMPLIEEAGAKVF